MMQSLPAGKDVDYEPGDDEEFDEDPDEALDDDGLDVEEAREDLDRLAGGDSPHRPHTAFVHDRDDLDLLDTEPDDYETDYDEPMPHLETSTAATREARFPRAATTATTTTNAVRWCNRRGQLRK